MIVTRIFAAADGSARLERREVPMQPDRSGRPTSTGEGHITRTLEGKRGFAHIPVGPEFDITRWPLA